MQSDFGVLPPLRQDLRLLKGGSDEHGAPRWLLFDVPRHKYFTISKEAFYLLQHWQAGISVTAFQSELARKGQEFDIEDLSAFIDFITHNHLVLARSAEGSARLYQNHLAQQTGLWRWLIHHYLFFRIPLLRPDAWLERWLPRVEWIFRPACQRVIFLLGVVGVLLAIRQWDQFQSTFMHFFSLEGLLLYGITLLLIKSAHELGHAFTAKRLGCRVPSMGVAFLVMLPVLYTDTTDAWRLRSRAQRLSIVTAGVRVELYLALVATFAWNILPEGPARSAAFFVATTSWITSLLVNISPFLRFDGYYAFSDWLGIENLQQRAFALGRWRLRQWILGLNDPLPEPLSLKRVQLMVAYAWATWVYRFFLFLGIALLVYHFFFKALGITLFLIEIFWFILLPMLKELQVWYQRRKDMRLSVLRILCMMVALALIIWALIPMPTDVSIPAVLRADPYQKYFAPEAGRVEEILIKHGSTVQAGQPLIRLGSDELEHEYTLVEEQVRLTRLRLDRVASSLETRDLGAVLKRQLARLLKRKEGLEARRKRMQITATDAGRVVFIRDFQSGVWVGSREALIGILDADDRVLEGYVHINDLELIAPGQEGVFITDRGDIKALPVRVSGVDLGSVGVLPAPELASANGGHIPVRPLQKGQSVPEDGRYRIRFAFTQQDPDLSAFGQRLPGIVVIQAESRSWLVSQFRLGLSVILRESGF